MGKRKNKNNNKNKLKKAGKTLGVISLGLLLNGVGYTPIVTAHKPDMEEIMEVLLQEKQEVLKNALRGDVMKEIAEDKLLAS